MQDQPSHSLSCSESRQLDQRAIERLGIPGLVLMENAGRNCADVIRTLHPDRVVLLCGTGNNGGDGFVIARHLAAAGVSVDVFLLGDGTRLRADAATNFRIVGCLGLPLHRVSDEIQLRRLLGKLELTGESCIVDAMLGTGSSGRPRPPFDAAIEWANGRSCHRVAVDLPSGLNADSGECSEITFRADITVTFVSPKTGFCVRSAHDYLGRVEVVDIGVSLSQLMAAGA